MQTLRFQLFISHLLLVGLLLAVCLLSVGGFFHLGGSVDRILRNNYQSVQSAQTMKEALERMDDAAGFYLAGDTAKARKQYADTTPVFQKAFQAEQNNVTEQGEQEIVTDLERAFDSYRQGLQSLLQTPSRSRPQASTFYFQTLQPRFVQVKARVDDVATINQNAIVQADAQARVEARRAAVLSLGITAFAVTLGLGWAGRTIHALMTPLVSLTRQAEQIGAGHLNSRIETRRTDEIGTLARTFNTMAQYLQEARHTEEIRLHVAERKSDAALANLYDPVIVADASGRVLHLNRAAEGLFGSASGARGRDVLSVVKDARLAHATKQAAHTAITSAEEGPDALVTLHARTYRVRATPMREENGAPLGAVAVLEDVTYQQEIDRIKTEFIGVASHELRTPVTSLLLGLDLLREGAAGPLSSDQREIVEALQNDGRRLEQMMRDLLDLTRLEAQAALPRFELRAPADLVENARQAIAAPAQAANIAVHTEIASSLPLVRADGSQIGRVFANLLTNAVRHTPRGGSITIGADDQTTQSAVRFWVRDTGSGIPAAYLPRIFERFVQVPRQTRGGAGLGLSLAQAMVQSHEGTLSVESDENKGSTFFFTLAAVPAPNEESQS